MGKINGDRIVLVGHIAIILIFLALAIIALTEKNMAAFAIWIALLVLIIILPIVILKFIPQLIKKSAESQKQAKLPSRKRPKKALPKKKFFLLKLLRHLLAKKKKETLMPKESAESPKEEPEQVIKIETAKIEPILEAVPSKEKAVTSTQVVKTDFDRLIEYASQEKEVPISAAAKHFKIPKEKIEEWAKILSDHGLLEITYPAFGEPRIHAKGVKKQ